MHRVIVSMQIFPHYPNQSKPHRDMARQALGPMHIDSGGECFKSHFVGIWWAAFVSPKIASPKAPSPKIASPNPPKVLVHNFS